MQNLVNYYIVHRATGISYNPTYITTGNGLMLAISNKATATREVVINVKKLIAGLSEKRYRLVPKTM